jgi:hypothetical protein
MTLSYSSLAARLDLPFRPGEFVRQPGSAKPLRLRDTSGGFRVQDFPGDPCRGVCLHFLLVRLGFEDGVDQGVIHILAPQNEKGRDYPDLLSPVSMIGASTSVVTDQKRFPH